ncbi:acyl-homoserine-lactone synthase TraI [Rhizobium sp. BT-226]|uniref:acyl-homoserine-lactone synthase n=1 Tax=Rhizobium sp. BT-226 TaxID=2986922 RepID=UPI0021F78E42|nr:acyl-homoserine-lactone synthase TraI [Rhizobium sp. BT-226]MCW0021382.1 acyl-homoserine-lactone synthase TraI [Rhizobium sp. BT-226]
MEIAAIHDPKTPGEREIVSQMHRLRARVFKERLSWNVRCAKGMEYDKFDALSPTYIIALTSQNRVVGCARLLPATGPTMLAAIFPQLLPSGRLDAHARMIESSRFCVDTGWQEGRVDGSLHKVTIAMFAGIVEWCLLNGYSEIATATDVRFERILKRVGWPLRRLGPPTLINETCSVAGILPADPTSFERLRPQVYCSTFAVLRSKAA